MRSNLANFSGRRPSRHSRGWTLVEMAIALGTSTIVLGSILVTAVMVANSMTAIGNYADLDRASRNTLDVMNRDLRNTATVVAFSSSQVTVSNTLTGDLVTYAWDGSNDFTRSFDGTTTLMLTNCDYLCFEAFQRNPTNNFQFLPASTPSETKLISVSWRCSRQILGAKINTESVQTAEICIRN